MRILIGTYTLFDGPTADWSIENLRAPFTNEVDEVQPARASEITPIARGLRRTELSGTISRGWPDLRTALQKVALMQTEIPLGGLITLEVERPGGGFDHWYMNGAFKSGTPYHHGSRTFLEFSIIGGAFRRKQ